MKINVSTELLDLQGKVLKLGNEKDENATVALVCKMALLNDDSQNGMDKYESWKLAREFEKGGELELTSEQISKVKKLVHKIFTPTYIGPVFDILEGVETKEKKTNK